MSNAIIFCSSLGSIWDIAELTRGAMEQKVRLSTSHNLSNRIRWISQGTQFSTQDGVRYRKGIPAQQIDMLKNQR